MSAPTDEVRAARELLEANGYVVLRAKSYRQAQERQRVAQALLAAEKQCSEGTRQWAADAHREQRRLADRLTHVYGVARAHGATVDELRDPIGVQR